jgi:hypothetical protein
MSSPSFVPAVFVVIVPWPCSDDLALGRAMCHLPFFSQAPPPYGYHHNCPALRSCFEDTVMYMQKKTAKWDHLTVVLNWKKTSRDRRRFSSCKMPIVEMGQPATFTLYGSQTRQRSVVEVRTDWIIILDRLNQPYGMLCTTCHMPPPTARWQQS